MRNRSFITSLTIRVTIEAVFNNIPPSLFSSPFDVWIRQVRHRRFNGTLQLEQNEHGAESRAGQMIYELHCRGRAAVKTGIYQKRRWRFIIYKTCQHTDIIWNTITTEGEREQWCFGGNIPPLIGASGAAHLGVSIFLLGNTFLMQNHSNVSNLAHLYAKRVSCWTSGKIMVFVQG